MGCGLEERFKKKKKTEKIPVVKRQKLSAEVNHSNDILNSVELDALEQFNSVNKMGLGKVC